MGTCDLPHSILSGSTNDRMLFYMTQHDTMYRAPGYCLHPDRVPEDTATSAAAPQKVSEVIGGGDGPGREYAAGRLL